MWNPLHFLAICACMAPIFFPIRADDVSEVYDPFENDSFNPFKRSSSLAWFEKGNFIYKYSIICILCYFPELTFMRRLDTEFDDNVPT